MTGILKEEMMLKQAGHANRIENGRTIFVFAFLLLLCNLSIAQIKFDVKTTLEEKTRLHVVKLAVINALQQSNWASVNEIGEDYSVWLTNLRGSSSGDTIMTEVDFNLRTPAMFTRGNHISARHVSISFDTTGISNAKTSSDSLVNDLLVQGLQSSGALTEFTKLFASSIPFGSIFVNEFISKVLKELNRQPTPLESLEANLVAAKTVVELQSMIVDLSRKK